MDRLRRLMRVWNWLPAFRVVAETEHLPTASQELHVTPSALSRTIKQLEDELGEPLFQRVGRRLVLSPSGRELLASVREAMLKLEQGLSAVSVTQFVGPLRIATGGPLGAMLLLPALKSLRESHPLLVPHVASADPEAVRNLLVSRLLDLAVIDRVIPGGDHLTVHELGRVGWGVYCSDRHPLFREAAPTMEDLLRHSFVAQPEEDDDVWPRHFARDVGMVVGDVSLAVNVCASGELLALLPDPLARAWAGDGMLRRLPLDVTPARGVYAVHRELPGPQGPTAALVDLLRESLRRL
ncbi:MAG: LysR family transcriptional regulator [Myxococcota bacterium]|nr:LysR family transcriptional regulator [Myxococcota bacterium]